MFGMTSEHNGGSHSQPTAEKADDQHFSQIVGNLYVKGEAEKSHKTEPVHVEHTNVGHNHTTNSAPAASGNMLFSFAKTVAPYIIVFSVAIFLYLFFFSKVDLAGVFKSTPKVQTAKETVLSQLAQQNSVAYNEWVNTFYFEVRDSKIIDPESDNSGNGLTNFQKFLLNLNPKSYDTLGLGMADSQALQMGINPLTGNKLADKQKEIVDKYFDFEIISNRLTLAHLQRSGQVAGANTASGSTSAAGVTNNTNQQVSISPSILPQGDTDVNTNVTARLKIPALNVDAPLTWTKDPKDFDKDLLNGVVHYPGTALPGQIGTVYISGHSSNYVWAKGDYNNVFTRLDKLADNTSFQIVATQKNGKPIIFHYVVNGRQEYKPTDQAQFKNAGQPVVALSTCWPVGSTAKRLVVFGVQTQVEK